MDRKDEDAGGKERRIRETNELLQELRVVLPGVQVLFAFLLTVAFTRRFTELAPYQQNIYFTALMSAALAAAFLTAPTTQHRLLWRQHERPHRLRLANALTIAGSVFLALAVSCVVFLVADVVYGISVAAISTAVVAVVFAALWYALPLYQRLRRCATPGR